ncbi:Gfo/Idh/MocA family oxidoreductase [Granulicella paludicola]|uniref:Gfo/Idh/MocA family oxidoreductase n=1 Tax=Granulicella paludicola TaxID=474951 RepID=UPI0021E0AF78|nr:Gfo/Idh/MocA family oxidoreductase [Granulicella paludicola]
MSRPPIRTAVLGYGLAGRVFHCPFVAAVPGLELSAIALRSPESAAKTAEAVRSLYPTTRILSSIDEAIQSPEIDLIVVGTPNDSHVQYAEAALKAGKHVVVDKPLAPTSGEANHLIDLAARLGLVLAPFHNRRFDGDFQTVRKLIHAETLGRVVTVSSHMDRFRPIQRPNTWKEAGGPASGLLFDLGPHLLDQALALFGTPTHVTASIRSDRDQTEIDDVFDIALDFTVAGRALRYECHATMLAAEPSPRFLVHGTKGSYTKFGIDPQEPALIAGSRLPLLTESDVEGETSWIKEPESQWGVLTTATQVNEPVKLERSDYPTVPGDYRHFYVSVRNAIRGDSALAIPASAGYRSIRLIELAIQASSERRTLPVEF